MIYECPHCHADNQDMFVDAGDNTMLCTACDKEFDKVKVAMQTRCIYCLREQYAMAVHAISHGEHPCVWCGKTPPVMTYDEWYQAIAKRRQESDKSVQNKDS